MWCGLFRDIHCCLSFGADDDGERRSVSLLLLPADGPLLPPIGPRELRRLPSPQRPLLISSSLPFFHPYFNYKHNRRHLEVHCLTARKGKNVQCVPRKF